jgi:hypothetical protein
VRKARVRPESRKFDVVITSARYQDAGERLVQARGFERRGAVWSDTRLFDRESLSRMLREGRRVGIGSPTELPGDFEVGRGLRLEGPGWIVSGESPGGRDDLGVPLY